MLTFFAFILFYICTFALPSLVGRWKALPKEGLKRQQVTSQTANAYFFAFILFPHLHPHPIPGGWVEGSQLVCRHFRLLCGSSHMWRGRNYGKEISRWFTLTGFGNICYKTHIGLKERESYSGKMIITDRMQRAKKAEAIPFSSASIGTMGRSNERTGVLTTWMSMSLMMIGMIALSMIKGPSKQENWLRWFWWRCWTFKSINFNHLW